MASRDWPVRADGMRLAGAAGVSAPHGRWIRFENPKEVLFLVFSQCSFIDYLFDKEIV